MRVNRTQWVSSRTAQVTEVIFRFYLGPSLTQNLRLHYLKTARPSSYLHHSLEESNPHPLLFVRHLSVSGPEEAIGIGTLLN